MNDTANHDRDAEFPGGTKAWLKAVTKNLYFPEQYKIVNADKTVVVINFRINEDGQVSNVYVSVPVYPQFDKIAKLAIEKSPKWIPAIQHNRPVKAYRSQPVTFSQD